MLQVAKIIFLWDHTPPRQAIIFSLLTLRTVISVSKDGRINMEAFASSQMEPTVISCPCDTEGSAGSCRRLRNGASQLV